MVSSNMSRENTTQNLPVNSALVQAGELHLEQISTDEDTGVTALEIAASGAVDGSSNYIMCVKTEAGEVQEGSVLEVHPRLLQEVTDVEPGDQDRGHPPTSKRQKLQWLCVNDQKWWCSESTSSANLVAVISWFGLCYIFFCVCILQQNTHIRVNVPMHHLWMKQEEAECWDIRGKMVSV